MSYMIRCLSDLGAALILVGVGVPLAACTSPATAPAGFGQENRDIVVAQVPTTSAAGLYIAEQQGFFTAAGLHVTIKPVVSLAGVIPELVNGSIQVEVGQWTSAIAAEAGGTYLHALAAANSSGGDLDALVTGTRSKITSPAQLHGKTVLVNAIGGLAQLLAESVLAEFQVQPSQTRYLAVPFPSMAEALQHGTGDAAVLPEPFLTQAEEKLGLPILADLNQGAATDLPLAGYVAASSWVRHNPAVAAAFVQALHRGQLMAATDRSAVEQVLPRYIRIDQTTAAVMALGAYPVTLDAVQLDRVGFLMQEYGQLSSTANVKSLVAAMTG
jgi:NitT/TauT family transport system substrate-binding protein